MTEQKPRSTPPAFPGREEIRALLRHRPMLNEAPDAHIDFGDDPLPSGGRSGIPSYTYSEGFWTFIEDLYRLGFVANFDWPDWQREAEALQNDPARLRSADLTDLVKLLTVHARKDRFCDGHLAVAFQEGWFRDILDRMAAILAEMDASPAAGRLIANRDHLSGI